MVGAFQSTTTPLRFTPTNTPSTNKIVSYGGMATPTTNEANGSHSAHRPFVENQPFFAKGQASSIDLVEL